MGSQRQRATSRRNKGTRGTRFVRRIISAALAPALIVSISGSPVGATGSRIRDVKYGYSLVLPRQWQRVSLDSRDLSGLVDLLTKDDLAFRSTLKSELQQAIEHGIDFFAIGPIVDRFAPNINVIVESSAGLPSGDTYFQEFSVQLKLGLTSEGFRNVKTSVINLPIGREIDVTYSLKLRDATPSFGVQYYIRHKTHVFIVTFTSATLSGAQAVADVVGRSWKWN